MKRNRVVLVDGNPQLLELVACFLRQSGKVDLVRTHLSGAEALATIAESRPDVVVIDLDTPGLTQLETIAHLRDAVPGTRIVVTCLISAAGYRQVAQAAGADAFVSKIAMRTDLLPTIRAVCSGREGSNVGLLQ